MGLVQPELSLDFRHTIVLKTIGDFLKEVSMIGNVKERLSKLDGFVKGLEEEMRKIDAFKRELPLCMLLLNDAIMALKEETMQCTAQNAKPILEEFIPLKKDCDENEEKYYKDKKNWMSSVQLFPSTDIPYNSKQNSKVESKRNEEENRFVTEHSFQLSKNMAGSRTYMPFKPGFLETVVERKGGKEGLPVHGLSLLTPGIKNLGEESGSSGSKTSCSRSVSSSTTANVQSNLQIGQQQQQTARKQRRCWSPELHRRFVNALQQLGGSQAATPKQIRELMQVDGLTNDEVKSHLQKYRLHTRRLPAASTTPANQSGCVLGGLWMPQDQYNNSSKASSSQSGSPQGPLQLAVGGGGTSTTGANSMDDDEEDQKSENYNWKSHIHKSGKDDV